MATLMQKDVLIELVATVQAKLVQLLGCHFNDDQLALAKLRQSIYQSEPEQLDYVAISDSVKQISDKYTAPQKEQIDLEKYDVDADVEEKFPLVWANLLAGNEISAQAQPVAILLGGQPGAGKSHASKIMLERLHNNLLVINGDEFRPYHQYFDEIYKKYGKDFSKYTGEFSGKMVEKVRNSAIAQKFNILIEGTFRHAELPLQELANFKQHGYHIDCFEH